MKGKKEKRGGDKNDKKSAIIKQLGIMTSLLPVRRTFDGAFFYLKESGLTKTEATGYVATYKKKGRKARAVKTKIAKWCVYVHRERTSKK